MVNNQLISLILPCKDEGRALKEVLRKLPKVVDEVIVVNNNSKDNTGRIARSFGAKVITEARHKKGIGYGYSISAGINASKGDIVVCMDGDDSYPTEDIGRLVNNLQKTRLDFISCNRIHFRNKISMSFIRVLGVKILNILIWLLYGYKIQDALSGMWVFRRKVVKDLDLFEGDWNLSLEIKLNMIVNPSIKFTEMPISYHDRLFDSSKQNIFLTGAQHMIFLLKRKFSISRPGINLLRSNYFLSSSYTKTI
jgi:dolichol-phosphate hexosyltransferase